MVDWYSDPSKREKTWIKIDGSSNHIKKDKGCDIKKEREVVKKGDAEKANEGNRKKKGKKRRDEEEKRIHRTWQWTASNRSMSTLTHTRPECIICAPRNTLYHSRHYWDVLQMQNVSSPVKPATIAVSSRKLWSIYVFCRSLFFCLQF